VRDLETLIREAFQSQDDDWLAWKLSDLMNETLQKRKKSGGFSTAPMPDNAPETLAQGEFNRFYARGVCVVAAPKAWPCGWVRVSARL
jgi:hypothetical protein